MKSLLKYFVFLICLNFIEGAFRCDYKYSHRSNGWFKHFVIPATWSDAWLWCSLEGAVLASPTTLEIKADMMNIINESTLKKDIFTGIHATLSQGDYHSIEGTPLAIIPVTWAENEPDNKDNQESCITFNSKGEVADSRCEETRPYICYHPENPEEEATACGTVDSAYNLDPRTNKCYKFHLELRNFSRASFACNAEGGHLAVVNSDTEATVLKEIFAKIPKSSMLGISGGWQDLALIGFYDRGERWVWTTVHGQSLEEAGYNKWNSGEPSVRVGEYCGSIWRNGYLNDVLCDRSATFICEKSPDYPGVCRVDQPTFVKHTQSCG